MNRVMIDFETLSLENNPHILSVGAYLFDGENKGKTFYVEFDHTHQPNTHISAGTVAWWMQQGSDLKNNLFGSINKENYSTGLRLLNSFLQANYISEYWSHEDTDIKWLNWHFTNTNINTTPHYKTRGFRTIASLCPEVAKVPSKILHHALEDAISQGDYIFNCLEDLNRRDY